MNGNVTLQKQLPVLRLFFSGLVSTLFQHSVWQVFYPEVNTGNNADLITLKT